jgi:hypothetical protein
MTEEIQVTTADDVFGALTIPKILIAALETLGEIQIPTTIFLNAAKVDKELQVDYNSDNQIFTFKLKAENESGNNNNQLINDFE